MPVMPAAATHDLNANSRMQISLDGHSLTLLPSGAVLSADTDTLWVADVHLGKAATFRSLGLPVPQGTTSQTLAQLSHDIEKYAIAHLVVLGDFLHGKAVQRAAATINALGQWRERHARLRVTLVRGNHDDKAGDPPPSLGIDLVDQPFALDGLLGCHDLHEIHQPLPGPILHGHIHPVVRLTGRGKDRLRLPCFVVSQNSCLLPAYGAFTGGFVVQPKANETCYVLAGQTVYRLPGSR